MTLRTSTTLARSPRPWRRVAVLALWCALAGTASAAPDWRQLTPAQQQALAPLQGDWNELSTERREKWLRVAGRYPGMNASERERLHSRMREWAQLSPIERGQARLRYQEARKLSPEQRQERWAQYQALTPEERERLAHSAASAASAPTAKAAPRRDATPPASQAKSNVVQGNAGRVPVQPIAPAVVQAKPGATTTLISRPATPPAHQSTGLPKIAASPELVNHSTLLPTRGAQGAAATPADKPGGADTSRP